MIFNVDLTLSETWLEECFDNGGHTKSVDNEAGDESDSKCHEQAVIRLGNTVTHIWWHACDAAIEYDVLLTTIIDDYNVIVAKLILLKLVTIIIGRKVALHYKRF